jgi:SAM-dependent methyltransferase
MRRFFRARRFRDFRGRCGSCTAIADIGDDYIIWDVIGRKEGVFIVNLWVPDDHGQLRYVLGNGCRLPFGDRSIDLAFSNSAIEHVGSFEQQLQFAAELLQVGRKIYCQTPRRWFPIDPHLSTFFLHWLPGRWLTSRVLRYFMLNGRLTGQPYHYDVAWLSKAQLRSIFPGRTIKIERFLGLPKAFIVTS